MIVFKAPQLGVNLVKARIDTIGGPPKSAIGK